MREEPLLPLGLANQPFRAAAAGMSEGEDAFLLALSWNIGSLENHPSSASRRWSLGPDCAIAAFGRKLSLRKNDGLLLLLKCMDRTSLRGRIRRGMERKNNAMARPLGCRDTAGADVGRRSSNLL